MKTSKILVLASTSSKNNIVGGVVTKSRILWNYLKILYPYQMNLIDTDSWRSNPIKLVYQVFKGLVNSEVVIISSFDIGAAKVLRLLSFLGRSGSVYYFVGGGELHKSISSGKYPLVWYKGIRKIYVESTVMVDSLKALGLTNAILMRNFRDTCQSLNACKVGSVMKFVFFARVIEEKGIRLALKASKKLQELGYSHTFDFYGPVQADYLGSLTPYMDDTRVYKGCIIPDGSREYQILNNYDVLLLPTFYPQEGFPGTIIDAYIAGLAVVSSDFEYAKEFVDSSTGRICKMNDVDSLYECMKELLLNPDLVYQLKRQALTRSKEYDVNTVLDEFNKDLQACLE